MLMLPRFDLMLLDQLELDKLRDTNFGSSILKVIILVQETTLIRRILLEKLFKVATWDPNLRLR